LGRRKLHARRRGRPSNREKAKKVLDEIVSRSHVKVPDTFSVKPPEQQPMQGVPNFTPPGPESEEPEPPAKPGAKEPPAKEPAKPAAKPQKKP
jgi:hypothetical protein